MTVFLPTELIVKAQLKNVKIDQLVSIAAETEQILNRRNFSFEYKSANF